MRHKSTLALFVLLGAAFLPLSGNAAVAINNFRVSLSSAGGQANGESFCPSITPDGRYVAFDSTATNLVPGGDTNGGGEDAFLRDRATRTTVRIDVNSSGDQANSQVFHVPAMSSDGRIVAFDSQASNIAASDPWNNPSVFIRNLPAGSTTLASVNAAGYPANIWVPVNDTEGSWANGALSEEPFVSGDGRFVVFISDATNLLGESPSDQIYVGYQVYLHDRQTGATTLASVSSTGQLPNDVSSPLGISSDGRYILFYSAASNLVPGDTNGQPDIFVHDRVTGATERVSVGTGGVQGNDYASAAGGAISADGRFVAFLSAASNLVSGDTNGFVDVFVRDRVTGKTERVDVSDTGQQSNADSGAPTISADGRYVFFDSHASSLAIGVLGDTWPNIFVRDRATGKTEWVNIPDTTQVRASEGRCPAASADNRFVAFSSGDRLAADDTNGVDDVYVHDRSIASQIPTELTLSARRHRGRTLVIGSLLPSDPRARVTVRLIRRVKVTPKRSSG